jgi:arginine-tRNA-protein transferase
MRAEDRRHLLEPPELLVYDDLESCPYLAGRTARLPMRFPLRNLTRRELDQRLAAGDRRQGTMLYRTACPGCQACEPLRVDAQQFRPNRAQRRVFQRGEAAFDVSLGPAQVSPERLALYTRHKRGRGLDGGELPIDAHGYSAFLVDTCCETFELCYMVGGKLVGVAVVDRGQEALSAVYCFFDPRYSRLSPGTYSILKQLDLCRRWGMKYLYLGFYIAQQSRMTYKGQFFPHERLVAGHWRRFERRDAASCREPPG